MNVLLTGANGQLGRELQATCPAFVTLVATDRDTLDITDPVQINHLLATHQPDAIINAAAYTAVDKAESDVAAAYAINQYGAGHLAQAAAAHDSYLMHISTDFVFDGSQPVPYLPADTARPLGVYGASKLAGEQQIQEKLPAACIVRTAWLYSVYGNNFVKTMLRLMRERDSLGVVCDQTGTPTWTGTVADTLWSLLEQRVSGVWHCTDNGTASWYDFAVAIQEEALALGLLQRVVPIRPLRTAQYPTPAHRPAYSVLDRSRIEQQLGIALPHWRVSLRRMLRTMA